MRGSLKTVALAMALALGFTALAGCIVVPDDGYYHHHRHWDRDDDWHHRDWR
jgi:hypothetical protein